MHHKPFGGLVPPGPAGGAYSAPGLRGWTPGKGRGGGKRQERREGGREEGRSGEGKGDKG